MPKFILPFFLCFFASLSGFSQPGGTYEVNATRATDKISLDGVLDEAAWKNADRARYFYQNFPYDTALAAQKTEAMVTYDDNFIYVGAICYDTDPGEYIIQSLKRDYNYSGTDGFGVFIDPFSDQFNGFAFGVSPLGVQMEGLIENGGSFGITTSWDNRWFAEVHQIEDGWTVEIAIPFKTLRFKEGVDSWRINFSRNNLKANENSSWVPVPRNFNIATLSYTGVLQFDAPLKKTGSNISIIPYVSGGYQADYEQKTDAVQPNIGLDAKVAVTSALNLDLTINPDFSQVEVDRQVTNLSRFSLFFPERRQFFIENSDLFANFGFSKIRPFFSRRIGLQNGQQVPILAGARLSGKLTPKWRVGLMNMQTEGGSQPGLQSQNFTVAAVQRQVFGRSNIAAIFVNRQAFEGFTPDATSYNRVMGLDFNLASKTNKWRGKFFYHYSLDGKTKSDKGANAGWLMYNTRPLTLHYNHEYVEENYNAEVGFVPRQRYFRLEPNGRYRFFPKKGKIQNHGPTAYASIYWDNQSWQLTDRQIRGGYQFSFSNRSEVSFGYENWYLYLTSPFDPTGTNSPPLPDSVGYSYQVGYVNYESDFRKKFNYYVYGNFGGYFTGQKYTYGGGINFRKQPWGIFSLSFEQNEIVFPDTAVSLSLIGPRFEFSFTRNFFFTTFLQYNTQRQNFNINARLQWRFKPMSDLFLVITDNYRTPYINVRNRAVVLKLNYWFTL